MANMIASELQVDVLLDAAMTAFMDALLPLGLFSTVFRDVALEGTNKMQIPYYALDATASRDFAGTYLFDDTATDNKEVTIDKRKYQGLALTSEEYNRQPYLDPEKLGALRGRKLAEDVLADILSVFTAANYGAAVFTGIASTFDVDDVIAIEVAVEEAKWPVTGRGMILKPSYTGELKKDANSSGGLATFGRDTNGSLRTFPMMQSFSFAATNYLPSNGENLVGVVSLPSAVLIGFSPITPAPAVMKQLVRYETLTDESGFTMEYREWGDADDDVEKRTIECNYGYAVGEAAAGKRLVSA